MRWRHQQRALRCRRSAAQWRPPASRRASAPPSSRAGSCTCPLSPYQVSHGTAQHLDKQPGMTMTAESTVDRCTAARSSEYSFWASNSCCKACSVPAMWAFADLVSVMLCSRSRDCTRGNIGPAARGHAAPPLQPDLAQGLRQHPSRRWQQRLRCPPAGSSAHTHVLVVA